MLKLFIDPLSDAKDVLRRFITEFEKKDLLKHVLNQAGADYVIRIYKDVVIAESRFKKTLKHYLEEEEEVSSFLERLLSR